MSIGQKIKDYRLQRNLTQEYMAQRLQMTTQGYGKIENDKTDVSLSRLQKIAEELGVSLGALTSNETIIANNYGEIKDQGRVAAYYLENSTALQILQDELALWKKKHEDDVNYYRALLDKLLKDK